MKFETKVTIALIIIVAYGIFSVAKVMADKSPLDYSDVGCTPYTRGMVTGHQAAAMTHSDCGQARETSRKVKSVDVVVVVETPVVTSTVVPSVTETPSIEETPAVETTPEVTPEVETPVVSENGNPGNDKPVGNAGEKCNMGMCENVTHGNRGRSN